MSETNEVISIKHRVLGTLVLVSLAVIFLPMLFSKNDEFFSKNDDFIPTPPDKLKTIIYRLDDDGVFKIENPTATELENENSQVSSTKSQPESVADAVATSQKKEEKVAVEKIEQGNVTPNLPEGLKRWMAQLGSFGQENNALVLRDKIREMGFPAFVDKRNTGDDAIWRVRVGPYVTEKEAETALSTLQKKLKLKGLVIRHQ